eukprot:21049-Pleurochrysis_carterae.AAC.2
MHDSLPVREIVRLHLTKAAVERKKGPLRAAPQRGCSTRAICTALHLAPQHSGITPPECLKSLRTHSSPRHERKSYSRRASNNANLNDLKRFHLKQLGTAPRANAGAITP